MKTEGRLGGDGEAGIQVEKEDPFVLLKFVFSLAVIP